MSYILINVLPYKFYHYLYHFLEIFSQLNNNLKTNTNNFIFLFLHSFHIERKFLTLFCEFISFNYNL